MELVQEVIKDMESHEPKSSSHTLNLFTTLRALYLQMPLFRRLSPRLMQSQIAALIDIVHHAKQYIASRGGG
jgi:hypothetical protein